MKSAKVPLLCLVLLSLCVGPAYSSPDPIHTVILYADNLLPSDSIIDINGLPVKNSNYSGVPVGRSVYYYCLAPHSCFCPVCRGEPGRARVQFIEPGSDEPLVIYTLTK
ncbi:MAG: hypothetical protein AB1497_10765 [Bacillota bacterium]